MTEDRNKEDTSGKRNSNKYDDGKKKTAKINDLTSVSGLSIVQKSLFVNDTVSKKINFVLKKDILKVQLKIVIMKLLLK